MIWRRLAKYRSTGLALLLAAMATTACGASGGTAAPAAPPPPAAAAKAPAGSSQGALQHITVAYSAPASPQTVLWVAHDAGLFKKYGLDATIKLVNSNAQPAVMQNGQLDFGFNAAASTASAILGGAKLTMIALWLPYLAWWFFTAPSITTPAQLRGKIVAQLPILQPAHFADVYALQKLGIPLNQVRFQTIGTDPAMIAAARAGQVQALAVASPDEATMAQMGWHLQVNALADHVPYPTLSVAVPTALVKQKPALVLAFLKAVSAAVPYMEQHPGFTGRTFAKWTHENNPQVDAQVAKDLPREIVQVPSWTPQYAQVVLKKLAATLPKAAQASPGSIYDDSFVHQLIQQGFYTRIDGKAAAG